MRKAALGQTRVSPSSIRRRFGTYICSASSIMGNGKDFFIELRKQVTSLSEKEKAGG